MEKNSNTHISKDLKNKKLTVVREFNASIENVWRAWTEADLLDQWWMPKPWFAKTKSLKFEVGGNWLYSSTGPDGTVMWSIVEFLSIKAQNSFQTICNFCDENGNKNPDFPSMYWKITFIKTTTGTKVEVELSFTNEEGLEKIIKMGFQEGFTMALGNLEELLKLKIWN